MHKRIMKALLSIVLIAFFVSTINGQISYSDIDFTLTTYKSNDSTELVCSNSAMSLKFKLNHNVTVTSQKNLVEIDNHIIQITILKINDYKKSFTHLDTTDQKQLLNKYSKYELNYFKYDLNIDIINPSNQWVMTKTKGWFIWYFRIGNISGELDKKTDIMLFASTIITDKIITINAPMLTDEDFSQAANIVNEMMESLKY